MTTIHQRFAALQWEGLRDYQEDDFGFLDARDDEQSDAEHTLILVADGMGGHNNGAHASQLVTEAFIDSYQNNSSEAIPSRLHKALLHSNDVLAGAVSENPELEDMGTTLVAAVIHENSLHWISVGDSPLWLQRQGELQRLNADHSMAPLLADMVANGKMSAEEAASDPGRHSLLAALMGDALEMIDQSPEQGLPLQADDLILLASDGILTVDEASLLAILEKNRSRPVQNIAEMLVKSVKDIKRPGQDNLTLALYRPGAGKALAVLPPKLTSLPVMIGGGVLVLLVVLLALWLSRPAGADLQATATDEKAPPVLMDSADSSATAEAPAAAATAKPSAPEVKE